MSTHRFILEPYKGIATRHTCPECHKKRSFARYIDTEGKIEFPPYVDIEIWNKRHVQFQPHDDVNIIMGINGSGKTSFLKNL